MVRRDAEGTEFPKMMEVMDKVWMDELGDLVWTRIKEVVVRVSGGWAGSGQDVAMTLATRVKAKPVTSEEEDNGQGQESGEIQDVA